jgi:hypothetical protein
LQVAILGILGKRENLQEFWRFAQRHHAVFTGQSPTNVESLSQACQLERAEGGRHEGRDRSPCCVISDHYHAQSDKESKPTRTWLQNG